MPQGPEHPEAPSLPGQEAGPGGVVPEEEGDRPGDSGHAPGPRLAVCPWQGHQLPELTAPPRPQDRAGPHLCSEPGHGWAARPRWELARAEGGARPSHVSAFSARLAKVRGTSSSFACHDGAAGGAPLPQAQPRAPGSAQPEGALSLILRGGLGFGARAPDWTHSGWRRRFVTPWPPPWPPCPCLSRGCCQVCSGITQAGQGGI